jgi:16S rRNA (cytosine1402-N4)-methyltransferase
MYHYDHIPVLLEATLSLLAPQPGGVYIDATIGGGGHAERILEMSTPDGRLLGIDADPLALQAARERLSPFGQRVVLVNAYFDRLASIVTDTGFKPADGVLFDLGVSSAQLATADRGFSFQLEGPLDMRMGPEALHSAADIVNTAREEELTRIFREYGEERFARRIARHIVASRQRQPIRTTTDLVHIIMAAVPARSAGSSPRIHPATRVFQALRIAVNDELGRLQRALPQALDVLRVGGHLVVISFHSLEDRIVKRFFQAEASGCICPPQVPACVCGRAPTVKLLTRKPIQPDSNEITRNPRARSAKLRAAEKIGSVSQEPTI